MTLWWGGEEEGKEEGEEKEMNFDEVLRLIGGFGRFQKILYVWICLPQIFLAFHMLVSVFTGAVPPHVCRSSSGLQTSLNFTLQQMANSCSYGNQSGMEMVTGGGEALGSSCPGGWEYSSEIFHNTIVTEVSSARKNRQQPNKTCSCVPVQTSEGRCSGVVKGN